MPVNRRTIGALDVGKHRDLWQALACELAAPQPFGQPLIDVEQFPRTGLEGVTAIWDRLAPLSDVERSAVVLRGYQEAYGEAARNKVAFAVGFTVPEAVQSGHLPFAVVPLRRDGDPVTIEDCYREMVALGASMLTDPARPILAAATFEQAKACVDELVRRLPASRPVWCVRSQATTPPFLAGVG